jgi:cytidine deaminase
MPRNRAALSRVSSATPSTATLRRLARAARQVRRHAYAPYSEFAVGAAVLTAGGTVHVGCNVENGSYGATLCAERSALAAAVAGGARRLKAVAVVTGAAPPSPPCGICLQALAEFMGPEAPVVLAGTTGEPSLAAVRLDSLLPRAFQLRRIGSRKMAGGHR